MLMTTWCGRYQRRTAAGISKEAWEVVKDLHAAEFENDGKGMKKREWCVETPRG